MGILHLRVTEANQIIKLDRAIHGQNMTLRKIVVIKNKDQSIAPLYNYKGGISYYQFNIFLSLFINGKTWSSRSHTRWNCIILGIMALIDTKLTLI
jgi:hypothetical protein